MKIKRFILLAFSGCCLALSGAACSGLEGDNSDFDFGDMTSDAPDNPYDGQGYDRLPNSVRLATYNTHRSGIPGARRHSPRSSLRASRRNEASAMRRHSSSASERLQMACGSGRRVT